jgi:hypothetical protein
MTAQFQTARSRTENARPEFTSDEALKLHRRLKRLVQKQNTLDNLFKLARTEP